MNLHDLCRSGSEEAVRAYIETVGLDCPEDLSYVLNLKNDQRYCPIHCSIFARNLGAVKALVASGVDIDAKCHGTPPLHLCVATAVLPHGDSFSKACLSIMLENGVNVSAKDDQGFSALHVAAECNSAEAIELILNLAEDSSELVNYAPKLTGYTALHRAAAVDASNAAELLIKRGANILSRTSVLGMTALHLAAEAGNAKVWAALLAAAGEARTEALAATDLLGRTALDLAKRSGWTAVSPDVQVLTPMHANQQAQVTCIVTNPLCAQHHTCPPSQVETPTAPPENTKRLHVLIHEEEGVLEGEDLRERLSWVRCAKPAALADILRVHEWSYVRKVQEHCARISSTDPEDEVLGYAHLDGDTAVSCQTYNAALAAAGAVCQAVDLVAGGPESRVVRSAFCPVRPPGHHAGPRGLVKGSEPGAPDSHGFCILNNVSIGAAYAMNRYRDTVKKVAIVDFDVHHGNGTEETVRWLRPRVEASPISGPGGDIVGLMQTVAYKPWHSEKDSSNVMFVSVHGYGPRERGLEHMLPMAAFYPGTGRTVIPEVPHTSAPDAFQGMEVCPPAAPTLQTFHPTEPRERSAGRAGGVGVTMASASESDSSASEDGDERSGSASGRGENSDEEGDEDEDETMGSWVQQHRGAEEPGPGSNALYKQVFQNRRMLGGFAHSGDVATEREIPPLILDIGVSLPGGGSAGDGSEGSGRGKVLDELHYRIQWRRYFREQIFPRLVDFEADMIFVSAGFDAHKKDTINGGYIALVEEDFQWVTDKLVQLANSHGAGRLVSVLEGGYQLGGEHCSAFAQSAKAHVRSLCYGARSAAPFCLKETQAETALEMQHLEALEEVRRLQLARKEEAREQAYLARMQQLERRQAEEAAEEPHLEGGADSAGDPVVGIGAVAEEAGGGAEGGAAGRKRRRAQVDYVALDKELRGAPTEQH